MVVCVDANQGALDKAKERISKVSSNPSLATYVCSDSLVYLSTYSGSPFDFAFLDSSIPVRGKELQMMVDRGLLVKGAFVCIHDTSKVRTHTNGSWDRGPADLQAYLRIMKDSGEVQEVVHFPLSRGLTMVKV